MTKLCKCTYFSLLQSSAWGKPARMLKRAYYLSFSSFLPQSSYTISSHVYLLCGCCMYAVYAACVLRVRMRAAYFNSLLLRLASSFFLLARCAHHPILCLSPSSTLFCTLFIPGVLGSAWSLRTYRTWKEGSEKGKRSQRTANLTERHQQMQHTLY